MTDKESKEGKKEDPAQSVKSTTSIEEKKDDKKPSLTPQSVAAAPFIAVLKKKLS